MGYVLGIDFAPRHSGWALLDADGSLQECGVIDAGPQDATLTKNFYPLKRFVTSLAGLARTEGVIVMEDVSHYMANPAHVLRLQGAVRAYLHQTNLPAPVMVYPVTWQKFFGWQKTPGTTSKGFATFACGVLGYDTSQFAKGKASEDVHDAILIARWFIESTKQTTNEPTLQLV